MMFCWLHILTVLFWFMKVLWVVMAAATTLSYPNEIVDKHHTSSFENTTIKAQKNFEDGFRGVPNSNSEFNNNNNQPITREVEFHSVRLLSENTTDVASYNDNRGMNNTMEKERDTKECDKVCEDMKRSKLSENVAIVRRFPLRASLNDDDVLSDELHEKEFMLRERDISSTYELDNYRSKPDDNNTSTDSVRFKTVKGVNNDNSDYVSSLSTSADDLLSAVPSAVMDKNENSSLSISSNRTVDVFNSDGKENASSHNVHVDKTKVTSKPSTDSFTTSSDKFSKGSLGNAKPTVKMNKNRTLQEIKSGIQIKYSEESKKKVVVKTLNDNISLQMEVTQADEDSSVLLMNDEPANVSGLNKNRGSVHVANDEDDDSLEFSPHDIGNFSTGVNGSVLETNETFSTAAHGHTMKTIEESSFSIAIISGIVIGVLIISSVIGAVSYIFYRHRYWNKPHTLSDKCSNADSSGYIDDSTLRDNSEEMYSLDNDSFLNSLEAMTIQNYWTDNVKHTKL